MLTTAHADHFSTFGFVVLRGFLADRVAELCAEADMAIRDEQAFHGFDRARYPVWRDWLDGAAAHPRRAPVIGRMRQAGVLDLPGARDGW